MRTNGHHTLEMSFKGAALYLQWRLCCFKTAMLHENSYHLFSNTDSAVLNILPACRNDRELGVVSGLCGYETVQRVQNVTMSGRKMRL
jgi:hypothetical protein